MAASGGHLLADLLGICSRHRQVQETVCAAALWCTAEVQGLPQVLLQRVQPVLTHLTSTYEEMREKLRL